MSRFARTFRIPRRAVLVLAALAALVAIAAAVLPLIVDVDSYRGLIRTKAEQALGRKVAFGAMKLSVLPSFGIEVADLEVDGLLRARSLTVGVRLLPLLFGGAVDVRHVGLDQPEILATRGADGRWSFEGPGGGAPAPGAGASDASGGASAGRAFSLSRLRIARGTLRLKDEARRPAGPPRLDLGIELDASVQGSGAGDLRADFEATLRGDGLSIDMGGRLARAAPPGATDADVTVKRADIGVARARELLTSAGLAWPLPDGLLRSAGLQLSGQLQGRLSDGALSSLSLTDVVVRGADLRLSRDRKGTWNFESLVPATDAGGASAGGEGPAIVLKNLHLEDAKLALRDETVGGGSPVDLEFNPIDLVVEAFERDRPIALRMQAALPPKLGVIRMVGAIPMSRTSPLDLKVDLENLDARAIGPYLESLTNLSAASGAVTAHVALSGSWPQKVTAVGSLSLDDVTFGASRPIEARAEFDLTAQEALARLAIGRFDLSLGRSRLSVRGTWARQAGGTVVDLELPPSSIDASDLEGLAALAGVTSPVEFSSSRPVSLQARVKGDIAHRQDLDLSGSLEVADFTFKLPVMDRPMEQVRGRVTLRANGFDVSDFSGVIGRSDLSGTMSVTDLQSPRATFRLSSKRADFWELMSFMKTGPDTQPAAPGAPGSGSDGLIDRVTARGTLAIGEGAFDTLAFRDLTSTVDLNRKVLRLDPVAMTLYGGRVGGSASMDMNREPAVYAVAADVEGVDVDALLTANLQLGGMLAGALSGRLSVTVSGATRQAALGGAKGAGDLRIEKGKVGAVNVLKVLSRASDLMGERSLREVSSRMAKEGTEFSVLTAALEVGGGKVRSQALSMTSPDFELKDEGSLDLLAGTIDLAGEIIFSEAVSQAMVQERSKAVDYFWDSRRARVDLPLRMSGPIAAPTPNIDWGSAGGRLARRKAEEAVRERLESAGLGGLLGSAKPAAPAAPGRATPPAPAASADLGIAISEKGFSGSPLLPDLKIRGTLTGIGIVSARARVMDGRGATLHDQSLMEKVDKYYTTHDRGAPAAINFRVEVDGKRLLGARGDLKVTIEIADAKGGAVSQSVEVSR